MTDALTLIAQISDLHIKAHGRLSYKKVDTHAALLRVIDTLNQLVAAPGHGGDHRRPGGFRQLRKSTRRCATALRPSATAVPC